MTVADTEHLLSMAEMDQILSTASKLLPQPATDLDYIKLTTSSDDPQNNTSTLGIYSLYVRPVNDYAPISRSL